VVRNSEACFTGTERLLVQYDQAVPSRTKIATSPICVCIKFGSECRISEEKEEDGKLKQIPVYFASEALSGSKIFYSELEKIAYAVIMAARKMRHYFEGHRIRVITNQPLSDLFTNREASIRIIKWGAELSEYIMDFERRSAIKSQVLADFVMDWTSPTQNLDEEIPTPWIVQCDGAWCYKGVGISAVVSYGPP
jgi:hypothetical protein